MNSTARVILPVLILLGALKVGEAAPYDDVSASLPIVRSFARQGRPESQFMLGAMYFSGAGVPQNYGEAASWFRKAAEIGDRNASYLLGSLYARGLGVARDSAQATKWYRNAAERGHPGAQTVLGFKYLTGSGVAADDAIAARWVYRAAQQGIGEAQLMLAKLFASGKGVRKDISATYTWAAIAERTNDQTRRSQAAKLRQTAETFMTPELTSKAQKIANDWMPVSELPQQIIGEITRQQGATIASLKVQHGEAVIGWRIVRRSAPPVRDISGTVDGRPMGIPVFEPYPQRGAVTSVLILLDVTDPLRKAQVDDDKLSIAKIFAQAKPFQQIAIATYGEKLQLWGPDNDGLTAMVNMEKSFPIRNFSANLGRVLRTALEVPSLIPAERQGIFVFTDGHSDDALNPSALVDQAKRFGTSLNFILKPSERAVDLSVLEALAAATGGEVVLSDRLADFLMSPFELLDNGATVHFPLNRFRGNDGSIEPEVKVALQFGDDQLELTSKIIDETHLERDALEEAIRSCDTSCSKDFRTRMQDRLDLILQDEGAFRSALDDLVRLRAYINDCRLCAFRDEARRRVSSIELEELYMRLERAGLERERLEAVLNTCGPSCPEILRVEVQSRLALGPKIESDKATYLGARGDIATLRSYVSSCTDCFYAENARQDIALLEKEQRNQIEPGSAMIKTLGLGLANLTEDLRKRYRLKNNANGVLVTEVELGSRAARQSLTGGDVIVEVAGEPVANAIEAQKRIEKLTRDGRESALLIIIDYDGEARSVEVPLQ